MSDPAPIDGDVLFPNGMNSLSDAWSLSPGSYVWGLNVWNRGGSIKTRPGFRHVYDLPDGNLQGFTVFNPRNSLPQLIAVVDGRLNSSSFPFKRSKSVPGARLHPTSKRAFSVNASVSVERNDDGSLKLIAPVSVLILQDGMNPAISYDGYRTTARGGENAIPQGTVMAWSGGRLWVGNNEKLIAGDIGNPFTSYERSFNTLGGLDFFVMPGNITAMHEMPGMTQPPLLVFTDDTTTAIQSSIATRSTWTDIQDFVTTVFPSIGCNAAFSPTVVGGKLWWHSLFGWMNVDSAAAANQTTTALPESNEMDRSARALSNDRTGICGISFDNILLSSVPYSGKRNKHTWVYDTAPERVRSKQMAPCWSSVWTGVAPVQWAKVVINGKTRLFCASKDEDGKNRVYEAFSGVRDNGCDFPWAVETRAYTGNSPARKHFRFAELQLRSLLGKVNVKGSWAGGSRGPWKQSLAYEAVAPEGNIYANTVYNFDTQMFGLIGQSRTVRTQDVRELDENEFSSCKIESVDREAVDTSFQLRIDGSGPCEIKAIRMFMDPWVEPKTGECAGLDATTGVVRYDGAASDDIDELQTLPTVFSATKTVQVRYKQTNYTAVGAATVLSVVSQADADKRANQLATQRAEYKLRLIAPKHIVEP